MSPLQAQIQKACMLLGLRVEIGFDLDVGEGQVVHAIARIPDLGFQNGMLVFDDWAAVKAHADRVVDVFGFGYSCLFPSSDAEVGDIEEWKKIFRDWSWSGAADRIPDWF